MPGKFVWIIFLLLGVWQVIGSIAEKAAKKQREQRLKGQASPQREPAARRHPGTTPASTTLVDRAEQLAARRKDQLEELRRRRATRHHPGAASAGSAPVTLLRASRTVQPLPTLGPATPQAIAAGRAVRTAPPAPVRPAPPGPSRPVPEPRPAEQHAVSKTEFDRGLHALGRAKSVKPVTKSLSTATDRHLRLPGLAGEPIGPALLRKIVLYREILDIPVALRDQQTWERW